MWREHLSPAQRCDSVETGVSPWGVAVSKLCLSGRRGSSPSLSCAFSIRQISILVYIHLSRTFSTYRFLYECRSRCSHVSGLSLAIHATVCCGLVRRCSCIFFAHASQFKSLPGTLCESHASQYNSHVPRMWREGGKWCLCTSLLEISPSSSETDFRHGCNLEQVLKPHYECLF